MQGKKACLVVDLRDGKNLAKITDINAVLAAAGWRTDITLKTYGGESMKLAAKAARQSYDLVIAYGGDGTLNQIVNGVMNARGHSIVGAIPAGTANEWAGEIGIPLEHVKAALTLVNSDAREVDLGHMQVHRLVFPRTVSSDEQATTGKKTRKKQEKRASKIKHHFLLMAGLGIDATIIEHISKALKYRTGMLAFGITTVKELPELHPFPAEIWEVNDAGNEKLLWQGEAWQVFVANARRYGNVVDVAPHAHLDDGKLNVCVITASNLLATIEQITSLVLRHKPEDMTAEYFQGAHFSIRVPASLGMHLDGGLIDLKDYLSKSDHTALMSMKDNEQVMIDYRFDAEPRALQVAIPRAYDGPLFEKAPADGHAQTTSSQAKDEGTTHQQGHEEAQSRPSEYIDALREQGSEVTVIGVTPNPEKKDSWIIAGAAKHQKTGDSMPVAVRVNGQTDLIRHTGKVASPFILQELREGAKIVVSGQKSKRQVIRATHVLIADL
jgi:YegS/Rv2252/BmrU family lipid kinase